MKWLKNLYNWVLKWAETPYGPIALFVLAFADAIFFPIPPDVLLIALALGSSKKAFRFALICTVGSVSGAFIGYIIGHFAWFNSAGEFTTFAMMFFDNIPGFSVELFNDFKEVFVKLDFWVIFTAGFTPIPYKYFTVSSGVFNINIFVFIIASLISRGTRFFTLAFLIWKFGPSIKTFIDKYFNLLIVLFTVIVILSCCVFL